MDDKKMTRQNKHPFTKSKPKKKDERKHRPDSRSDCEIADGNIGGRMAICNPILIPSTLYCDPVIASRYIAVFY